MKKLTIELTDEQHHFLTKRAAKRDKTPEVYLVKSWWGRMKALIQYEQKKKDPTEMPTDTPVKRPATADYYIPEPTKKPATKGKKQKAKTIQLYDSAEVAVAKAKILAQGDSDRFQNMLAEAGRNIKGVPYKD
jgi:hypothetical protein